MLIDYPSRQNYPAIFSIAERAGLPL